jgi:hypothetical protein
MLIGAPSFATPLEPARSLQSLFIVCSTVPRSTLVRFSESTIVSAIGLLQMTHRWIGVLPSRRKNPLPLERTPGLRILP